MLKKLKYQLFTEIYQLLRFGNFIPPTSETFIHKSAKIYGSRLDGKISIGEGCLIARCEIYGNVNIGRYSSLNGPNTDIYSSKGEVNIGQFCSIARNVSFQATNHASRRATTYPIFKNVFKEENEGEFVNRGNIEIANDVWIGAHSVILAGAKINDGAIVAANSVVVGEIPAYAIVAGSPAKVIKYRFSKEKIDELITLKWWNWNLDQIKDNKSFFLEDL